MTQDAEVDALKTLMAAAEIMAYLLVIWCTRFEYTSNFLASSCFYMIFDYQRNFYWWIICIILNQLSFTQGSVFIDHMVQKARFHFATGRPVKIFLFVKIISKCHIVHCSNSDDNLLKNIELFDKLSLRFNGRILFIKDVIGSQEICCWSYFGHGQKIAEVCCTSIVYGTDKKHTKVNHLWQLGSWSM